MFRIINRIIETIEEAKAARKYAAENNFNFVAFSDSTKLVESVNKHPELYDKSGCLMGRLWLIYTNNLFFHSLLHFVTGGVTGEYKPENEKVVTYPVTKKDRALMLK